MPTRLHEYAEGLRKRPTPAEEHMQEFLLPADGWKFQHPMNLKAKKKRGAIIDFYHHGAKLAVEIDGSVHAQIAQATWDDERSALLLSTYGIKVIRFTNEEVFFSTDEVLATINRQVRTRLGRPRPRVVKDPAVLVGEKPVPQNRHKVPRMKRTGSTKRLRKQGWNDEQIEAMRKMGYVRPVGSPRPWPVQERVKAQPHEVLEPGKNSVHFNDDRNAPANALPRKPKGSRVAPPTPFSEGLAPKKAANWTDTARPTKKREKLMTDDFCMHEMPGFLCSICKGSSM